MSSELLSRKTISNLTPNQVDFIKPLNQVKKGIVHIGIGAFHRAHQAVFTQDLMNDVGGDWGIVAVSLRSPTVRDKMAPQDFLYTVLECSETTEKVSLISAISDVIVAPDSPQRVIDELADPATKIVTLTVTEKGYCRDKSGLHLDFSNPIIINDLESLDNPKSLVGFLVAACKKRMESNAQLTVISCDNLPANGELTKRVVLEFADKIAPEVARWINTNVSFCNSMVDRIVPATTAEDVEFITKKIGMRDESVVITEPFKQWVIEDNFVSDKPAWDKVGAIFVQDVDMYERMKLRLLNGIHSSLAYVGFLMGYEYIHEAVNDPSCLSLAQNLQQELIKTLGDVPGINLNDYAATIITRFTNSKVPYKTSQVACDGSQKLPQRLIKPLEELNNKHNIVSSNICFVVAAWCRFLEGRDSKGQQFTINDPLAGSLCKIANSKLNERECVISLLTESKVASDELLANNDVIDEVIKHLQNIHRLGISSVLAAL